MDHTTLESELGAAQRELDAVLAQLSLLHAQGSATADLLAARSEQAELLEEISEGNERLRWLRVELRSLWPTTTSRPRSIPVVSPVSLGLADWLVAGTLASGMLGAAGLAAWVAQ